MTVPAGSITPTDLIAACSSVLEAGRYRRIREGFPEWDTSDTRLFEDEYNVVGVAVFPTWADLLRSWADLQASFVDVIATKVGRSESKAWDGYLVLVTAGLAPAEGIDVENIRRDTTRVRKLVATGSDLSSAGDVVRLLRPLLPISTGAGSVSGGTALDRLPDLLAQNGIDRTMTSLLVSKFLDQESMIDALHSARGGQ